MFGSIVDRERYPELSTGCTVFLPSGARCAMGARGTWYGPGDIAFHWGERFGDEADRVELNAWLRKLQEMLVGLLRQNRSQIDSTPFVLYRNEHGVVYAYGNGSRSYVYLAAVLRDHLPPDFNWREGTMHANWGGSA